MMARISDKPMPKDRTANLIPQAHVLTPEEKSIGGKNNAQNRRNRKRAREIAEMILSLPMVSGDQTKTEDLSTFAEINDLNTDVLTGIIAKLAKKALDGNYRSAELLLTLSGDYAKRMELQADVYDESSALFDSFMRDPDRWNINHQSGDYMLARMFEWYCYRNDRNQIAMRFNKAELEEIRISFTHAVTSTKIEFAHMVCGDNKIPDDESLFLYESKYEPDVMKHLFPERYEPKIPQNINEFIEMQKGQEDGCTDQ